MAFEVITAGAGAASACALPSSAMAAQSAALAANMRDGLVSAGLSPSNYLGSNGLWQRGDLAAF